jgi:hypothetical protein
MVPWISPVPMSCWGSRICDRSRISRRCSLGRSQQEDRVLVRTLEFYLTGCHRTQCPAIITFAGLQPHRLFRRLFDNNRDLQGFAYDCSDQRKRRTIRFTRHHGGLGRCRRCHRKRRRCRRATRRRKDRAVLRSGQRAQRYGPQRVESASSVARHPTLRRLRRHWRPLRAVSGKRRVRTFHAGTDCAACKHQGQRRAISAHTFDQAFRSYRPKLVTAGIGKAAYIVGCLTPPLLHQRSDMPCGKITSSS